MEEFLASPQFALHTLSGSAQYSSFVNNTQVERLRMRLDPYIFNLTEFNQIIQKVKESNADHLDIGILSFLDDFKMKLENEMDYCLFDHQEIEGIPAIWVGWMYPYDSMLQPLFDKFTFEIFQGIQKIHSRYTFNSYHCNNLEEDFHPVNFGFVQILFYILISGAVLSLSILVIEKLFPKK